MLFVFGNIITQKYTKQSVQSLSGELEELKKNHECIVTLEDGLKEGGWGYSIANYYATSSLKVLTYGGEKNFNDLKSLTEIYQQCRLTIPQMIEDILHVLKMKK